MAAGLVSLLMLAPLGYLLIRALDAGGEVIDLINRPRTVRVVINSITTAAVVGFGTVAIGVPFAWLVERSDLPARRFFSAVSPVPLAIPSYVGALTYIEAFGPQGLVKDGLNRLVGVESIPSIYGATGAWLALTLFSFPYVVINARAALRTLDPAYEEAARCLGQGPLATFFKTTLPQLRPAVAAGALLAALYAVSDFGVVTLLRYDTFTRAIYVQYQSSFNRNNAALLALMLVIFTLVLVSVEMLLRGRARYYRLGSGARRKHRQVPLGPWRWPALIYCASIALLSVGVPLGVLLYWLVRRWDRLEIDRRLLEAAWNSTTLGALTALAAVALAMPVALLGTRYRSRFGRVAERICMAGYGLPGLVVALAFIFVGARYLTPLYQTLPWLVLALTIRFLPQALGSERASLLQVSPRVEEAARSLGRSAAGAFRSVTVPLSRSGLVAGAVMVFLTVMKELPITLLLSPTGYRTLATEIWTAAGVGAFADAAAPAILLSVIAVLPTLIVYRQTDLDR